MEFKILEERLSGLDPIVSGGTSFTPVFGYGSKKDLMAHLRSERKDGESYYPLVWLMTPFKTTGDHYITGRAEAEIDLIVATLTNRDISNKERVRITFENTLEPLLENIVRSLRYGGNTGIQDGVFNVEKFFGYDTDSSNAASDVWDAITLQVKIKLKYIC